MDAQIDVLGKRLDRLERQNRKLKALVISGGAIVAGLALMGAGPTTPVGKSTPEPGPNVVEADRFLVKDADGSVRAILGKSDDGAFGLWFKDPKGKTRAALEMQPDGMTSLGLAGIDGKGQLRMEANADGGVLIALKDHEGKPRAMLSVVQESAPALELFDAAGKRRASLRLAPEKPSTVPSRVKAEKAPTAPIAPGTPNLEFYNAEGKPLTGIGVTGIDTPEISLGHGRGSQRVSVGEWNGGMGLLLHDQDGRTRIALALARNGQPGLELRDAGGGTRAAFGDGLTLWGPGKAHLLLAASESGPQVKLFDNHQVARVSLLAPTGDDSSVNVADRDGKQRVTLSSDSEGRSNLLFRDSAGKVQARLAPKWRGVDGLILSGDQHDVIWHAP